MTEPIAAVSESATASTARGGRKLLVVLMLANVANFYDRNAPSIVVGPIQHEFGLNNFQIGVVSAAFTVVYAILGVPLGRMSDRVARRPVIAVGLLGWSVLTALTGLTTGFISLLLVRIGIGIGEASIAPAANSMIADAFVPARRGRATGVYMLGLPIGTTLAYFTVATVATAFGTWRAPFFVAAVPGVLIAVVVLFVPEPARGASDREDVFRTEASRPVRRLLRVPTLWWLSLAALGYNVAAYSVGTFMVPFLQQYFGQSLTRSAVITGIIFGLPGLAGMTVGGVFADRARRRSPGARLLVGAVFAVVSAPLLLGAMMVGSGGVGAFAVLFAAGWIMANTLFTSVYPALADVIEPHLRATALGVMYALTYLLGGAAGPLVVGAVSDSLAQRAMDAAGAHVLTRAFRGDGLHTALFVLPLSMAVAAAGMFAAMGTVAKDRRRAAEAQA
jgi:MFS family permease